MGERMVCDPRMSSDARLTGVIAPIYIGEEELRLAVILSHRLERGSPKLAGCIMFTTCGSSRKCILA